MSDEVPAADLNIFDRLVWNLRARWWWFRHGKVRLELPEGPVSLGMKVVMVDQYGGSSAISSPSYMIYPGDPGAYWLGVFWSRIEAEPA